MFKYSKGNNRTLIYSFPPRKSFPLLGSSLLLARFPLSPGSFAQGNTAVFSYSSLLDPACYKGSARGQGATEGSKQMATARVEWIKGWKPPRCFWSHPTHQDLPEMPQGGWGALGPELIPHYMDQLLCLTLQSFRCPGSTRPRPPPHLLKGHSFPASQKQTRPSEHHSVKAPTFYLQVTQISDTGRSSSPKF